MIFKYNEKDYQVIVIRKNNKIGIKILASTLYLDIFFKLSLPYIYFITVGL